MAAFLICRLALGNPIVSGPCVHCVNVRTVPPFIVATVSDADYELMGIEIPAEQSVST